MTVRARRQAMAQSSGPDEETEHLLKERRSLVAVEGEKALRKEPILMKLSRLFLGVVAWLLVIFCIVLPAVVPTTLGRDYILGTWADKAIASMPYYGKSGFFILLWGGPIFLLVFCGVIYLYLFPRSSRRPIKRKPPRSSLGTNPLLVSGPFGIVSAAELLCIVIFTLVITWLLVVSIIRGLPEVIEKHGSEPVLWPYFVASVGIRLGFVGQVCLSLLFLPVARGSVLLRLVDIPFEHASKYHVWLGHFTMTTFSLHGLLFVISWTARGVLIEKLLAWKVHGIANLAGVIALVAGLFMWTTSFQYTRVHAFELFYYTHQLYNVFIIFMALHVGDFFFGICFAGIFLFAFDRFLRFCQSRKDVSVLSAKVLPCGTFEVVLPNPSDLRYNALSFVFLNVPVLDRLQWHPFSVSSSPKDAPGSMKFLIKPLGTWSRKFNNIVSEAAAAKCPLRLKAGVEGPYGHETSFFLDYESLLLVAGGIGVSPFVAVLRDILHRYQQNEPYLPKDVTLIWAVKHSKELAILDSLSPLVICPEYTSRLNLTVKAYVTREVEEDMEAGEENSLSQENLMNHTQATGHNPDANQATISHLVGSGDILWVGAAIAASLFGYIVITGLVGKFYLLPVDHQSYEVVPWWLRGTIVCLGILVSVWLFGGSVILLWFFLSSRSTKKLSPAADPLLKNSHDLGESEIPVVKLVQRSNTVYGCRPDLQEVFEGCAKRLGGSNVGVLVCGPEGLQSSVATQCRAFNTISYSHHQVAFSYHSVSFDL